MAADDDELPPEAAAQPRTAMPFQIGYAENPNRKGTYDLQIDIGGFTSVEDCRAFSEKLSTWLAGAHGWKTRVQ